MFDVKKIIHFRNLSKVTAYVIKTLNGLMPALQNRERLRV